MGSQNLNLIEQLLPAYFSGEIEPADHQKVEIWKNESEANRQLFNDMKTVWGSGKLLNQMEQFSAVTAFPLVIKEIKRYEIRQLVLRRFQRIAAILILPVIVYASHLSLKEYNSKNSLGKKMAVWHKVTTKPGTLSEINLPDGTHVWLNSKSELEYPIEFQDIRQVRLTGEAFFEVEKDSVHPFVVYTGNLRLRVLGTTFNVKSYPDDNQTKVSLVTGKLQVLAGERKNPGTLGILLPNQEAIVDNRSLHYAVDHFSSESVIAWRKGILLFDNDPMEEVVKKLSRWFNVQIELQDKNLKDYNYHGSFTNETFKQVLELLKKSAPFDYSLFPARQLPDGSMSQSRAIIYGKTKKEIKLKLKGR